MSGLSPAVETLKINFMVCKTLTGEVSWNFPSSLKTMDLDFNSCSEITDAGVTALVSGLSPAVETLKSNLMVCKALTGEVP